VGGDDETNRDGQITKMEEDVRRRKVEGEKELQTVNGVVGCGGCGVQ
jgi:hypothetical protein